MFYKVYKKKFPCTKEVPLHLHLIKQHTVSSKKNCRKYKRKKEKNSPQNPSKQTK